MIKQILEGYFNLLRYHLCKKYRDKQKELFSKRLKICKDCLFYNDFYKKCIICGCFVDLKTKVIYKLDENGISRDGCPKKYW